MLEKLVLREAGTGGKKREILQENKLGSVPVHQFGVRVVSMFCTVNECIFSLYVLCVFVNIQEFLHVLLGVCMRVLLGVYMRVLLGVCMRARVCVCVCLQ